MQRVGTAVSKEFQVSMLTKIERAEYLRGYRVRLYFSDGTEGDYDFAWMKTASGEMVEPMKDLRYFRRLFAQAGALCWPNGYDMDGHSLQAYIQEAMGEGNGTGLRWSEAPRRRAASGSLREPRARYRAQPKTKRAVSGRARRVGKRQSS
jgi:hypothetical protein